MCAKDSVFKSVFFLFVFHNAEQKENDIFQR